MSLYVLDTDILSLFREGHAEVYRRVGLRQAGEVVTTVITVDEHLTGGILVRAVKRPDRLELAYDSLIRATLFFSGFRFATSLAAIARFEALRKLKLNVGKNDLRTRPSPRSAVIVT